MNGLMRLPVANSKNSEKPWFADGLRFTCTQCGNCCTGGPGYVWITKEEIVDLAEFLKITREQTVERYCRKINGRFSLKESRNAKTGGYDCVFMQEQMPAKPADGQSIVQPLRTCSIYPVRPVQCRTFPFWDTSLTTPAAWKSVGRQCPGIGQGRTYTAKEIESVRDHAKWPDEPGDSR
jgi:uncharacterized protein